MRKSAAIAAFVGPGILMFEVLGLVGWHLRERHLSTDLKRTLTAAADETSTFSDIHAYILGARLQVRTDKDREVLGEFEKSMAFFQGAAEIHDRHSKATLQSISRQDPCFQPLPSIPSMQDLNRKISECEVEIGRDKREQARNDSEDLTAEADRKSGVTLYQDVRKTLGLPSIKFS